MTRLRLALLPHVFVAGHRQVPPRPAYISARDLRAAIAANAALMTFAGDDDATRAPSGHDAFATSAVPPDRAGNAAAGHAPNTAPDDHAAPRRGRAA